MDSSAGSKSATAAPLSGSGGLGKQDVLDATAKDVFRPSMRGKAVSQSVSGLPGFSKARQTPRAGGVSSSQSLARSTDQLTSLNLHSTAPSKSATSSRAGEGSGGKALASQAKENAPLATGLVTSRSGAMWKASRIPNVSGANRLMTPRQSTQSAFGRTISAASPSQSMTSPTSSTGSSAMSRRVSDIGHNTPPTRPTARTPPSLAAAAAAAASLVASRNAAVSKGGSADVPAAVSDQLKKRVSELEQELRRVSEVKLTVEDEKLQLEKEKADLAMELHHANKAKQQAEAAAKAAEKNAEQRLEDLLHQLDDAKHSTEAASTTSEFVRKALSQQLQGSVGLYAELEQERATTASLQDTVASLEQLRINQEALINSMELQKQRLKDDLLHEQQMNKRLAEQLQEATESAVSADELRKLQFEAAYLKDREDILKQEVEERTQELTVIKEGLSGLQEKFNKLRLDNLRLDQKLAEKASSESALQGRENQLKEELSRKVAEQQQLLNIVEAIRRQKEDLEGEAEQQRAALEVAKEQLSSADDALGKLRSDFDQLSAELRSQVSFKTSEVQEQQLLNQQLQQQLEQASDAKEQAEGHCQELQRNLERLTQELHCTRLERQQLNEQMVETAATADSANQKLQALQAELETAKQAAADAQDQQQALSMQLQNTEEYASCLKDELDKKNDESPELLALRTKLDEAEKQQAVVAQQLAALQLDKQKAEAQLLKLTADNSSLKQHLTSSAGDIDMLQKELSKKVQKTDALQAELNTVAIAKEAAEVQSAGLSMQLEQAQKQLSIIGSRDGELQTLAADLAAATSAKAALEARLAPKERQLQEARSANTALSEQVRRLSSQLTDAQKELQRVQEETHNNMRSKQDELISMAGELQAAKAEAAQLHKQLITMGVQLEAASAQISQQQAAMAALAEARKQLEEKHSVIERQCAEKATDCEQLQQQVTEKQQLLAAALAASEHQARELAAAEAAHQDTKARLAAVEDNLHSVMRERDQLLEQQARSSVQAAALNDKVQEMQMSITQLQNEAQNKNNEADQLKQQLMMQSTALRQLKEQLSMDTKELQLLREQQGKMRSDKIGLEIKGAEQAAAISQLSHEVHQLKEQLEDSKAHSDALERASQEAAAEAAAVAQAKVAELVAKQQQLQTELQQQADAADAAKDQVAKQQQSLASLQQQLQEVTAAAAAAETQATKHASEVAIQLSKLRSSEARCTQLQENARKQVLLLKELEHQKEDLLQQVEQLQTQLRRISEQSAADTVVQKDVADQPVEGNRTADTIGATSSFRRSRVSTCKVTRAAVAGADVAQRQAGNTPQQQESTAVTNQQNFIKRALVWSGGAGVMLAGVVVAAVRAGRPN